MVCAAGSRSAASRGVPAAISSWASGVVDRQQAARRRRRGAGRRGSRRCRRTAPGPLDHRRHPRARRRVRRGRVAVGDDGGVGRARRRGPAPAAAAASALSAVPSPRGRAGASTSRLARAAARAARSESVEDETPSQTTRTARPPGSGSANRAIASSLRECRTPRSQTPATHGAGASRKWSRGARGPGAARRAVAVVADLTTARRARQAGGRGGAHAAAGGGRADRGGLDRRGAGHRVRWGRCRRGGCRSPRRTGRRVPRGCRRPGTGPRCPGSRQAPAPDGVGAVDQLDAALRVLLVAGQGPQVTLERGAQRGLGGGVAADRAGGRATARRERPRAACSRIRALSWLRSTSCIRTLSMLRIASSSAASPPVGSPMSASARSRRDST